ncbi:hypothetical protein [Lysinibacillus capsici]|uniref:hypothetical protein n=1 Tax=Lysinibacillus capsici TaxID=2115968 RepID=UPI003BAA378C
MFYVYINEDRTCTVYMIKEYIPESLKDGIVEYPTIPEGEGILKAHEDGTLYIETIEPETEPDPNTETPIKPEPTETLEERITRLESIIEQNNLITVDAVLGVYEELVALREEIAASKGTTDNA